MSIPVKWFCAGCTFEGAEHDVRVHAERMCHEFGVYESFLMKPFDSTSIDFTSIGVTGFGAAGSSFTFIHLNRCRLSGCPNPVLEDDEVLEHMRGHFTRGEWPPAS
jgi:hypothetical protein